MDMNRAFFLRKEDKKHNWVVIDAQGQPLGRLASDIADRLRGKHKVTYTPHVDCGDYIVIINAEKVLLTGDKIHNKEYHRYSGWIGGKKIDIAGELLAKNPAKLFEHAVKGMLPKNILSRQIIKKLKVYAGTEHPHKAQFAK